ncbi:MAG: hypothetical protein K8S99_07180 [Planctomycetes bacterium]|nr:hypothetical protein [Planctomycetota bacterium]
MAIAPSPSNAESIDMVVREEVRRAVERLGPWGLSLAVHLGIVLLAVFLTWNNINVEKPVDGGVGPVYMSGGLDNTPGVPRMTAASATAEFASYGKQSRTVKAYQSSPGGVGKSDGRHMGGVFGRGNGSGPGSGVGVGGPIIGIGPGGGGNGNGGDGSNPFGSGSGNGGSGLKVNFFACGGKGTKIVFLVDASGSLIDSFEIITHELRRTINNLSEPQSFTVIFFQGGDVKEIRPAGLKHADAEAKKKFAEWIDPAAGNIIPGGGTNPLKAMELALSYKPQLVFLLSDNITGVGSQRFEIDQQRLLANIRRVNRTGVQINTIQFRQQDPLAAKGLRATMEMISAESNGVYTFIDDRQLNLR